MIKNFINSILCFIYRNGRLLPDSLYGVIGLFNLKEFKENIDIHNEVLISSESGIWLISNQKKIKKIFGCYSFGLALENDRLYMSISSNRRSDVISMKWKKNNLLGKPVLHFSQKALYHNEKIHQISVSKNHIYIANTCSNSITILNNKKNIKKKNINIYPFLDITGYPISRDHNHINSIQTLKDGIIFLAHNGGNIGSIIGLVHSNVCRLYQYKNRGCHDIILDIDQLIFSDSFGKPKIDVKGMKKYGSVYCNQKLFSQDSYFTRGLYLGKDFNIVGSSFHGKRDVRFKGKGEIVLTNKEFTPINRIKLPFSQVHDIIGIKGERQFKLNNSLETSSSQADTMLRKYLGEPIYEDKYYTELVEGNNKMFLPLDNTYEDLISELNL